MSADTLAAKIREIKERAEKATAQLPLTEDPQGSGYFECPMCGGEGGLESDYVKNFDTTKAAGVQIYGIGDDLLQLEDFVKKSFADIPYLLEQLEEALRKIERLENSIEVRQ